MHDFSSPIHRRLPPSTAHQELLAEIGAQWSIADDELLGVSFVPTQNKITQLDRAYILGLRDHLISLFEPLSARLFETDMLSISRFEVETGKLVSIGMLDTALDDLIEEAVDGPERIITISYQENVRIDLPGEQLERDIGFERYFDAMIKRVVPESQHGANDGNSRAFDPASFLKHGDQGSDEFPAYNLSASPFAANFCIQQDLTSATFDVTFSLSKFEASNHLNFTIPLDGDGRVGCKVRREDYFAVAEITPAHINVLRRYAAELLRAIENELTG